MAKSKAEVEKVDDTEPNGQEHRPFPWVEPFPKSVIDSETGQETVFVRAFTSQDITINGAKKGSGDVILPCALAHAYAGILSAPK